MSILSILLSCAGVALAWFDVAPAWVPLATVAAAAAVAFVRTMAAHVEAPVIMPMSNPTVNSEAIPEDLIRWSEGRALIGSAFEDLSFIVKYLPVVKRRGCRRARIAAQTQCIEVDSPRHAGFFRGGRLSRSPMPSFQL